MHQKKKHRPSSNRKEKRINIHLRIIQDPPPALSPVRHQVGLHPGCPAHSRGEEVPALSVVDGEAHGHRAEAGIHTRPTGEETRVHRTDAKALTQEIIGTRISNTLLKCSLTHTRPHNISIRIFHPKCTPVPTVTPSTLPTITTGHTTKLLSHDLLVIATKITRTVYPLSSPTSKLIYRKALANKNLLPRPRRTVASPLQTWKPC